VGVLVEPDPEGIMLECNRGLRRCRMLYLLAIALCMASAPLLAQMPSPGHRKAEQVAALPEIVPLPRPRPKPDGMLNLGPSMGAGPEPQPPSACFLALTSGVAVADPLPPIAEPNGCDALDVVRMSAVIIDKRRVPLAPPATLRCELATNLATWMRQDVAPAVAAMGAPLAGFDNYDSFECRGRNRVVGAKTSEHGRANALDIRAVTLGDGRRLELTDKEVKRELRERLRASACARFSTVLGPGSDGYHESHVHVDLIERRNGYRICQWNVIDVAIPLPRPRPAEAPPREEL
jgi:hypothetical protein